MIVDNGKYYLYRHVRVDKNEPFYVGIGKKTNCDIKYGYYSRASRNKDRSDFWKRIVKKTDFIIEIVLESNCRDFIQQKEVEFIRLYGRKDLGIGSLVNMTDGADNGLNRSQTAINKQLSTAKKNGTYESNIKRLRQFAPPKGSNMGYQDKATFLYSIDGRFLKEFKTREDCALFIDTYSEQITRIIRLKESHKGYICANSYMGDVIDLSCFRICKPQVRPVVQFDYNKKEVLKTYDSLTMAAKSIGVFKTNLYLAMKKKYRCKGFYWEYLN